MKTTKALAHGGTLLGTFGDFALVLVRRGETLAFGDRHGDADPMVEIFDARRAGPGCHAIGQYVGEHWAATIREHRGSLQLRGGWVMTADAMGQAKEAIEAALSANVVPLRRPA